MLKNAKKNERNHTVKKEKKLEAELETKTEKKESQPDVVQPKVTKVGTLLKNMRQEKGLKVADIAKRLCIRKQYLEAIEDSNYSEIPAFPYGTGFIRSYADYLGLNSGNIVELYKEETSEKQPVNVPLVEPQTKSAMPGGIYILASLLAMGILYGVWALWNGSNDVEDYDTVSTSNEQTDDNNEIVVFEELTMPQAVDVENEVDETTVTNDVPVKMDEVVPETTATSEEVEANVNTSDDSNDVKEPLVIPSRGIFVEALEETWIEVRNESKLYISKVLQPGTGYTLPNDSGLILSVGKLGGVNVYVNGVKTDIARVGKKMNIDIDSYLNSNH